MRQRSVNEKAVGKLIGFLTDLKKDIDDGLYVTAGVLQTKHAVSKSTYSACRKLNIITSEQKWNPFFKADRISAIKILEFLRQRSDKQADTPISDLWVLEIAEIKKLITEVVHNTKKQNKLTDGFKMSDRVYIAGQIAQAVYNDKFTENAIPELSRIIIVATDDLLSKLNG